MYFNWSKLNDDHVRTHCIWHGGRLSFVVLLAAHKNHKKWSSASYGMLMTAGLSPTICSISLVFTWSRTSCSVLASVFHNQFPRQGTDLLLDSYHHCTWNGQGGCDDTTGQNWVPQKCYGWVDTELFTIYKIYIHTYVRTYVHTYIHTLHTYITYIHYIHTYVRTYVHTLHYITLHTYIHTLHTLHTSIYIHICVYIYMYLNMYINFKNCQNLSSHKSFVPAHTHR